MPTTRRPKFDDQFNMPDPTNTSCSMLFTLPREIPEGHVAFLVQIENTYELYEDITTFARVVAPIPPAEGTDEYDSWLHEHVIPLTGVGHTDGDSWYDMRVYKSSDESIIPVAKTWDWGY